jgi:hypothetical protein
LHFVKRKAENNLYEVRYFGAISILSKV